MKTVPVELKAASVLWCWVAAIPNKPLPSTSSRAQLKHKVPVVSDCGLMFCEGVGPNSLIGYNQLQQVRAWVQDAQCWDPPDFTLRGQG